MKSKDDPRKRRDGKAPHQGDSDGAQHDRDEGEQPTIDPTVMPSIDPTHDSSFDHDIDPTLTDEQPGDTLAPTMDGGPSTIEQTVVEDEDGPPRTKSGKNKTLHTEQIPGRRIERRKAPQSSAEAAKLELEDLKPGSHVGNYVLKRVVGRGAQGKVWHAVNEVADHDCALKFITGKHSRSEWAIKGLRAEASVLFDLTHPSIVRLYNIEQMGPHLFLAMELIEGPSLHAVLTDRRKSRGGAKGDGARGLEVEECLWILAQLAPALDYAAAEGVTHRDIKPGNLMLSKPVALETPLQDSGARVKICDFGIAFVAQPEATPAGRVAPSGTPPYMAPEVLWGETPTPAADLFSLAATLFSLYRGEPPYMGTTVQEMQTLHDAGPPRPIETGDKAFDTAISRALSRNPADRQPSFDELLFEASGGRLGARARQRTRGYLALAAASSVVALLAIGYALDPFGLRRGKAQFGAVEGGLERDGVVWVKDSRVRLAFTLADPEIEEVAVVVDDNLHQEHPPTEPGGDEYQAWVDLRAPGRHTVELRSPANDAVLGQLQLFLDDTVTTPADPVTFAAGPHAVGVPIELRFEVSEPNVKVSELTAAGEVALDARFDSRGQWTVRVTPEAHAGAETWRDLRRFRLRDEVGNQRDIDVPLDVFDPAAIRARLVVAYPLATETWHLWDVERELARLGAWEAEVQTESLYFTPLELQAIRGTEAARTARLRELGAAPPPATLVWTPREDDRWDTSGSGAPVLYTNQRRITLSGVATNSRSPEITVEAQHAAVERAPELDRDSGGFRFEVMVEPDTVATVELVLPASGTRTALQIHHDGAAPVARRLRPAVDPEGPSLVGQEVLAAQFEVRDTGSGLASVTLKAAGTPGAALQRGRGEERDLWSADFTLPREGRNDLQLISLDRAGNQQVLEFGVVRDTTPPQRLDSVPIVGQVTTGQAAHLRVGFDERIASATATWRLVDAADNELRAFTVAAKDMQIDGTRVEFTASVPFVMAKSLNAELIATDPAGNHSSVTLVYEVIHDAWGAAPEWIRADGELISDPAELEALLGPELAAAPVVIDGGRRLPRCVRHKATAIEFVYVPSGTFHYGPGKAKRVTMGGFYIARTEVSGRQFYAGADLAGYRRDGRESSELPILTNRDDAGTWCARVGLRLPTEAQWEYAASGPEDRLYPWGNALDYARRNGRGESSFEAKPAPVAVDGFPLGRAWCGALQMLGNASEVCRDVLDPGVDEVPSIDPVGKTDDPSGRYVTRGGAQNMGLLDAFSTEHRIVVPGSNRALEAAGFRPVWEIVSH